MLEEERVVEFLDVGFLLGKINSYTFESFFFFFLLHLIEIYWEIFTQDLSIPDLINELFSQAR